MKIADFYETDFHELLDEKQIIQNNSEAATGTIHHKNTMTINNNFPENLIESVLNNQNDLSKLMETQNKLIEILLKNKN